MKRIMSGALMVLAILGFALVSGVNGPVVASNVGPMCWAGSCPAMSKPDGLAKAMVPGNFPTDSAYACGVASPAYTFYYDARALSCPLN